MIIFKFNSKYRNNINNDYSIKKEQNYKRVSCEFKNSIFELLFGENEFVDLINDLDSKTIVKDNIKKEKSIIIINSNIVSNSNSSNEKKKFVKKK